jgi:hypothetical protein
MPPRPELRRTRLLTAVTIAVGAATLAATSAANGELLTADGSADLSGAQNAPGATSGPDGGLVPATERAVATPPSPSEAAVGTIERLSHQQRLPSLQADDGDALATDDSTPEGQQEGQQADEPLAYTAADGQVITPERIFAFLDGRNAPLADQAETFVAAGVAHDVDPRVVVAIAIAESDAGKMHPQGTYNAWGWGGSGALRAWDSWEQSIDQYTERLGALYDTDNVDWEFASTYCPPNTQWWFDTVTWAIGQI